MPLKMYAPESGLLYTHCVHSKAIKWTSKMAKKAIMSSVCCPSSAEQIDDDKIKAKKKKQTNLKKAKTRQIFIFFG